MFEQATRLQLRYEYTKGQITIEDLWVIPLAALDRIAVTLAKQLRETAESVSFVTPATTNDTVLQLKFDIAKYIIGVRVQERDAAKASKERSEKKQKLLEIVARKQDAALENKTLDELMAEINAM
jgi:hypothetical protein